MERVGPRADDQIDHRIAAIATNISAEVGLDLEFLHCIQFENLDVRLNTTV